MTPQKLKTDCDLCKFMWLEPIQMWSAKDRLEYSAHLTKSHGWRPEAMALKN